MVFRFFKFLKFSFFKKLSKSLNFIVNRVSENSGCTRDCECLEDLGLYCKSYDTSVMTTCNGAYSNTKKCVCDNTKYWNGTLCGLDF